MYQFVQLALFSHDIEVANCVFNFLVLSSSKKCGHQYTIDHQFWYSYDDFKTLYVVLFMDSSFDNYILAIPGYLKGTLHRKRDVCSP